MLVLGAIAASAAPADGYGQVIAGIADRVAWWRLGEPSGSVAADEEATQAGSYEGGVTLGQAALPASTTDTDIALDGVDGRVEVPHNAAFALPEGTLLVWFRLDDVSADHGIVTKDASGANPGDLAFWWRASGDDVLKWYIVDGTGDPRLVTVSGVPIVADQTYAAVLRWGTGGMTLHLADGGTVQQVGSDPHAGGIDANANAWMLGASNAGGGLGIPFSGVLGDVVLWSRRLTDTEIEAATQAALAEDGTYEPAVDGVGAGPAWYLEFRGNLADRTAHGRGGSLNGSGGAYAAAIAPNVGTDNQAFDTQGTAWITIAHDASDVALTTPSHSSGLWDSTGRHIAHVTGSVYFKPASLPSAGNRAILVAKSDGNEYGWQFLAYIDEDAAVVVEAHTGWRKASIKTPAGSVSAGSTYHLAWQLAYDGIKAWLDGAAFENGYGNALHVFGLAADILGVVNANTFAWSLGADAAGNDKFDGVLDEAAVWHEQLAQADATTLAQQGGDPAALEHWLWGQNVVNESTYANIQAAIDAVNGMGGGTVDIDPGSYTEDLTLKSNVRLRKTPGEAGTVTITGTIETDGTPATLTDDASNFLTGDRTLDVTNSLSVGDVVRVVGNVAHSERWQVNAPPVRDPGMNDMDMFEIESRTGSSLTLVGNGSFYDFPISGRDRIDAWTPARMVAIEDVTLTSSGWTLDLEGCLYGRFVDVLVSTTSDGARAPYTNRSLYLTFRGCLADDGYNPNQTKSAQAFGPGTKECVMIDCEGRGYRHAFSGVADPTDHGILRPELHKCFGGSQFRAGDMECHGPSSGGIFWFLRCSMGAGFNGWKHDIRWLDLGLATHLTGGYPVAYGDWITWDGMHDCHLRDVYARNPVAWFDASNEDSLIETISNSHFENLAIDGETYLAPPDRVHGDRNGNASTYINNTWINCDYAGPA